MKALSLLAALAAAFLALAPCTAADAPTTLPGKADAPQSYQIANKKFGDLLRPHDADGRDGIPIVLYSPQLWKCMTWKFTPAGESQYILQNHYTSKSLASPADAKGAVVQVPLPKESADAPSWRFTRLDDGTYRITDPKTGQALTAEKSDKDQDVHVVLKPWDSKDEQKWQLKPTDPAKLTM